MEVKGPSQTTGKLPAETKIGLSNPSQQTEGDDSKLKKAYYGITGLPSIVDALFRALGRYLEVSFMKENPFVRLPFRYISETVRYGVSRLVKNKLIKDIKEKTDTTKEWVTGLKKAIEITIGSAVIEPNLYEERFARVGAGFLNTIVRFLARTGLVLTKILNKENLNSKTLLDESFVRTSARLIYSDTDNTPLRVGLLTLEQLFINQWLAQMPLKEHVLPWLIKQKIDPEQQLEKA